MLVSTVLLDVKVGCHFVLGPLRRGHVMVLRGRLWACLNRVCVRGGMLSVHISTPLWTQGTGGHRPCGYPAAVRGLRVAHVPLREPCSWMTRKYLAVFLGTESAVY